jgi:hypothetical protein
VRWLGTDGPVGTEASRRRGSLPEGGSGGGADKMNERVLYYRGEHRDRQDDLALAASIRLRHVNSACMHGRRRRNEWML